MRPRRRSPNRLSSSRELRRDVGVHVRGRIRHPDHATITLHGWHRVVLNTEGQSRGHAELSWFGQAVSAMQVLLIVKLLPGSNPFKKM